MQTRQLLTTLLLCSSLFTLSGCAMLAAGTAVTSGAVISQDRRTNGTIVEDNTIELKANQAIFKIIEAEPKPNIKIISYNNHVLLLGQAPTTKMRKEVENNIRKIQKVRSIHNEIIVGNAKPLSEHSKDAFITTKIKSEMLLTKHFKSTHVKVITERGVVYLLGIIDKKEEDVALSIARHTKGVIRVVKMFEYIP